MSRKNIDRRELFRFAGRSAVLAALGAMAVTLFCRDKVVMSIQQARERCVGRGKCRYCGVTASCVLPQALSFRALQVHERDLDGG